MHLQSKAEWWPTGRLSCSTAKFNVRLIYWGLIVVCRCHRRPVRTHQTPVWFYATNQWVCVYMRTSLPFYIFYTPHNNGPFYFKSQKRLTVVMTKEERVRKHAFVALSLRDWEILTISRLRRCVIVDLMVIRGSNVHQPNLIIGLLRQVLLFTLTKDDSDPIQIWYYQSSFVIQSQL